ncbi:MAG: hypothetical protein IT518_25205 [Burkholderiales bacterium]|nr:hypothetical protein [Burkholderiales bacterium]
MEGLAKDTIALLQYLLPGFLAAWVFYGLTSYPKPTQFERVVQALIFTLLIQVVVSGERYVALAVGYYHQIGMWSEAVNVAWSTGTALVLGVVFSYFANSDVVHRVARRFKVTRETSYPSEWFGAFLNQTFVVLHFRDERRLYGWPKEWPSEPGSGHFVMQQPSWLVDVKEVPVTGVEEMLVDVKDVKWIEFMNLQQGGNREPKEP